MSKFLIFIPLPKDQAGLAEQIIRSATCFLETQGKVERVSVGDFDRQGGVLFKRTESNGRFLRKHRWGKHGKRCDQNP